MTQADRVISLFGGLVSMAKALGHAHPTTVQGWQKSGRIPHWRHDEILRAAQKKKISRAKINEALSVQEAA